MKFRSYTTCILEAWATWEVLRKLGFKADDIFWEFTNTANAIPRPGIVLNIVLRAQGKELIVACSNRLTDGQARRYESEARKFMAALAAGEFDEGEMKAWLLKSYAWTNQFNFLMALKSKGFEFPFQLLKAN